MEVERYEYKEKGKLEKICYIFTHGTEEFKRVIGTVSNDHLVTEVIFLLSGDSLKETLRIHDITAEVDLDALILSDYKDYLKIEPKDEDIHMSKIMKEMGRIEFEAIEKYKKMGFPNVRDKWLELFEGGRIRASVPVPNVSMLWVPNDYYNKLISLYTEPYRAYHNLSHIAHCLDEFKEVRNLPEHPNEVEIAIWFHDAIYNPISKDNEEKSSQLAYQFLKEMEFPDSFRKKVYDLILTTKHTTIPKDIDSQVLVDIDLSILGRPIEEFDKYEKNIRKEYNFVPDAQFKTGRRAILQEFLNRLTIYSTDFFRQKYEGQARKNLERSLIQLKV